MEQSGRNGWQPVTNGAPSKTAQTREIRLPWVATSCRVPKMVRRGSTVRVRQRALQKRRKPVLFVAARLAESPRCHGYGALDGAFTFKHRRPKRRKRLLRDQTAPRYATRRLRRVSAPTGPLSKQHVEAFIRRGFTAPGGGVFARA